MPTESDSMGTIEVSDEVNWGAQTARSPIHFKIGEGSYAGRTDTGDRHSQGRKSPVPAVRSLILQYGL
jgi:hypothetical protein